MKPLSIVVWASLVLSLGLSGCAFKSYDTSISSNASGGIASKSSSKVVVDTIQYGNGDAYKGEVLKGRPHGEGVLVFANGHEYQGPFVNGDMHGQGKYLFKASTFGKIFSTYEGRFEKGKFTKDGKLTYLNGSSFVGTYNDKRAPLKGTMTYASGKRRIGTFKFLALSGRGEELLPSGTYYRGEFKRGKKHGEGILTISSGDFLQRWENGELVYESAGPITRERLAKRPTCRLWAGSAGWYFVEGDCESGLAEGEAIITKRDGRAIIEGVFKRGDLLKGKETDINNGVVYSGEWKGFKYGGQGTLYDAKGEIKYQGEFANNAYHGKGYCPYQNGMEPCEWSFGKRVDAIYAMRKERERIEKWQNTCEKAQKNLSYDANGLTEVASNSCSKEYRDIENSVNFAFRDEETMYYLQNGRGSWIETSVKKARKCREGVANAVSNFSRAMQRSENTIRSNNCPAKSQLNYFSQLRTSIQSDVRRQHRDLVRMEDDYVQMERKARSAAQNRIERERAEMWADTLNNFKNSLNEISRDMNQIRTQTNRVISQAYSEASRRKQERQRQQQLEYSRQLQTFKTGYAKEQKRKLAELNQKIAQVAAKNKEIDDRIAAERSRCIKGGHKWNSAGNNCIHNFVIQVKGWGPTTGPKSTSNNVSATSGGGSVSGTNTTAVNSNRNGSSSNTSSGGGVGTNTSSSSTTKDKKPPRLIPVFVSDYENSYKWSTEKEACKYAMAGATRKAETNCRKQYNGRRASDKEIHIPVEKSCPTCRRIEVSGFGITDVGYKCKADVTLQCKFDYDRK